MKQKEIFMQYILNNREYLENDIRQLQSRVRFRDVDTVDCLELQLAIERLNCFNDFAKQAIGILNLSIAEPVQREFVSFDYARLRVEKERNKRGVTKDES